MISFNEHFNKKLKEIFLYITDRCNLKCPYCYMPKSQNSDMPIDTFRSISKELINLGASKITFLGGEPTLHPSLRQFIKIAKNSGFNYLRLDTNGQFEPSILEDAALKLLNDICFSLDGVDAKIHGAIRTEKNYNSVINNIRKAVSKGYVVRVTTTINSLNIFQLELIISMLERMGVSVLNFHLISKNGRARNNKELLIAEEDWMRVYKKILPKIGKYKIKIRIPKRYASKDNLFLKNTITCEAAKASRMAITPDLKVYACPLLLDRNRYFAYFKKGKFLYTKNYQINFISGYKIKGPICPLLMEENYKRYDRKRIIPLCVSYKPNIQVATKVL